VSEVAEQSGLSLPQAFNQERVGVTPTLDALRALAKALDVPLPSLVGDGVVAQVGLDVVLASAPASLLQFSRSPGFQERVADLANRQGASVAAMAERLLVGMASSPQRSSGEPTEEDWRRILDAYSLILRSVSGVVEVRPAATLGSIAGALLEHIVNRPELIFGASTASAVGLYFGPIGCQALPSDSITRGSCSIDGYYTSDVDPYQPWIFYADDVHEDRARFTIRLRTPTLGAGAPVAVPGGRSPIGTHSCLRAAQTYDWPAQHHHG
jgi:hypothetical protein